METEPAMPLPNVPIIGGAFFIGLPLVVVAALRCQDTFHQGFRHWWTHGVSEASHLLSAGAHGFEVLREPHDPLGFMGLEHSHTISIDNRPDILSNYCTAWAVQ